MIHNLRIVAPAVRHQKRVRRSLRSAFAPLGLLTLTAGLAHGDGVEVTDASFKCMSEMTQVRHFFVDNLSGNLEQTIATAEAGQGVYPEGSLLQLVPFEAMVKRQKGFNPATNDWEFFFLDVSDKGTTINTRGFAEVNNGFGMNCFGCHVKAKPEFDMVCEQGHGCDPIPLTRAMFGALQRTDPRCGEAEVSEEDQKALAQIEGAVKELIEITSKK